jgi:hypothetical protein
MMLIFKTRLTALALAAAILVPTAHAGFTPLPLQTAANRELEDQVAGDGKGGWSDQGAENCLSGFPRGRSDFAGIPFEIPANGPAAIFLKGTKLPAFPESVEIPVPQVKAGALYLLLTYVWGGKDQVADAAIEYADGSRQEIRLIMGSHVGGWWSPADLTAAQVAWKGKNGLGNPIGAYLTAARVEKPDQAIRRLVFRTTPQEGSLVILGVTLDSNTPKPMAVKSTKWEAVPPVAENWFPISVSFDSTNRAVWETGYRTLGPAGSHGWLQAAGDQFKFADGTPARFWGVNYGRNLLYPPKEDAPMVARRTAKYGFNLARFHALDSFLLEDNPETSGKLNMKRLDRMEFVINELKKEGIYANLSICYARRFKPKDGVAEADKIGSLNNEFYFVDARAQDLYLEFLKAFLDHKNPYTGLRNADDPAIALCSVMNESNMFFHSLANLTPSHKVMLLNQWNDWLLKKYGGQDKLLEAWRVEGQGTPFMDGENIDRRSVMVLPIYALGNAPNAHLKRTADQTRFYYELQDRWFRRVRDAIRATGSKMLVAGTGWYGPGHLAEIDTAQNATLDYVDKHIYWDHGRGGWTPMAVTFHNQPMVGNPAESQLQSGFQRAAGKPFFMSEWNCAWPNDYTLESAPIMAAYGALQDWGGFNQFCCDTTDPTGFLNAMFDIYQNPAMLALEPLAHFLFIRQDVKVGPLVYRQGLDDAALHDAARKRGKVRDEANKMVASWSLQEVPAEALGVGRVEVAFGPGAKSTLDSNLLSKGFLPAQKIIRSATGELDWDYGKALLVINTPRTVGILGQLDGAPRPFAAGTLAGKGGFGAVHLSSLDGKPLGESRGILAAVVGRVRNTGQSYERRNDEYRLRKQGDNPIVMEPIELTMSLKVPAKGAWRITPLDGNGHRVAKGARELPCDDGVLKATLSNRDSQALHFLIEPATP